MSGRADIVRTRGRPAEAGAGRRRRTFAFVLVRDFTLSAFALFVDTLRLAGDEGDRSGRVLYDWRIVSGSDLPCRSSSGLEIMPTARASARTRYDYVVVVGGLLDSGLALDEPTRAFVLRAAAEGVPLIGLCTGSFVLAELGLLEGRRVAVSWLHLAEFRARFPGLEASAEAIFVVDGDRITCSGGTGASDLAGALVSGQIGPAPARKAAEILQIDRLRPGSDLQPRRPFEAAATADRRVHHALILMEQTVARPIAIAAIARKVGCTPRHLERIFAEALGLSPRRAYMRLRLGMAERLLEKTELPMHEVAERTGFGDPAQFSRIFAGAFGQSPSALRKARRAAADAAAPAAGHQSG